MTIWHDPTLGNLQAYVFGLPLLHLACTEVIFVCLWNVTDIHATSLSIPLVAHNVVVWSPLSILLSLYLPLYKPFISLGRVIRILELVDGVVVNKAGYLIFNVVVFKLLIFGPTALQRGHVACLTLALSWDDLRWNSVPFLFLFLTSTSFIAISSVGSRCLHKQVILLPCCFLSQSRLSYGLWCLFGDQYWTSSVLRIEQGLLSIAYLLVKERGQTIRGWPYRYSSIFTDIDSDLVVTVTWWNGVFRI